MTDKQTFRALEKKWNRKFKLYRKKLTWNTKLLQDFLLVYRQLLTQFSEAVTSMGHLLNILRYVVNDLRTNTNVIDDEIERAFAEVRHRNKPIEYISAQ